MTATIVVVVSVVAERSGPFIAALIAALPTAASATYIILAVEHPPAFVAAAAIGSMAANAAVAIFALTYTALAQRQGIVLSIAVATLAWFGIAAVLRLVEWTRPPAAGGGCCAGRRRGHDREPLDRLVCLRRVRSVPHRAGHFCGDRASARGREGGGCRARPCAACARWPAARISRSALSRRVDRRVVVARGWPCDHHGLERRALGRAAVTAAPGVTSHVSRMRCSAKRSGAVHR
jgi:uncharacterized membrane protein (GlpM family)